MGRFARVVRAVAADSLVTRLMAAFTLFVLAEYAVWVGMLVFAYEQGGATAVGFVALGQLLPGVVLAPLLGGVADRRSPATLLKAGYSVQVLAMAAMAAVLWAHGPALAAYALAVLASTAGGPARPAQAALMPAVAREARQLTATNVMAGWAESAGIVLAAALASVFLDLGQIGSLFAISALLAAIAAVLVARLRTPGIAGRSEARGRPGADAIEALRVVSSRPRPRLLVALLSVHYMVIGALDVLLVVLAIRVLGRGLGWVGYLNLAYGLGGLATGTFTARLIGRRLAPVVALSVALVGGGLLVCAFSRPVAFVAVALFVVGAGGAVLSVNAGSLLQRVVPARMVGRVFGLVEGLSMAGMALGTALTPGLVHLTGARTALLVVGLALPAVAIAGAGTLRRLDEGGSVPVVEIALLRSLPHFAELPAPALETLADALVRVDIVPGQVIIRQGDEGDRFYAIADGTVAITVNGQEVGRRGRGQGVGEVALLRRVPRTATVTALSPVTLLALDAATFLNTVAGHAPTRRRAVQAGSNWSGAERKP